MSGSEPPFLIDTNVLVYAYDTADEKKHIRAKSLLALCWQNKKRYAVTLQNLAEFFSVVTIKKPKSISPVLASQIIDDILSYPQWKTAHYSTHTLQHAIHLQRETKIHFWDTLIAAVMFEQGITHIFTENVAHFNRFPGIIAINPFEN